MPLFTVALLVMVMCNPQLGLGQIQKEETKCFSCSQCERSSLQIQVEACPVGCSACFTVVEERLGRRVFTFGCSSECRTGDKTEHIRDKTTSSRCCSGSLCNSFPGIHHHSGGQYRHVTTDLHVLMNGIDSTSASSSSHHGGIEVLLLLIGAFAQIVFVFASLTGHL